MKRLIFLACLFTTPCLAQIQPGVIPGPGTTTQAVPDGDLRKAQAACSNPLHSHKEASVQNGVHGWNTVYNAGWEHCADIEKAYADSLPARQAQQRAASEEAERQQSLDIANKLKSKH